MYHVLRQIHMMYITIVKGVSLANRYKGWRWAIMPMVVRSMVGRQTVTTSVTGSERPLRAAGRVLREQQKSARRLWQQHWVNGLYFTIIRIIGTNILALITGRR